MALTFKQRRQRDVLIGVIIAVGIISVTMGQTIKQAIFGMDIPGYAKHAPAGNFTPIDWSVLMQGRFDAGQMPNVPAAVSALNGQMVRVKGYVVPLHNAVEASELFVAAKPRGCYFCNPPTMQEVVMVSTAGGKKLPVTDHPVTAYGKFTSATGKTSNSLYSISDAVLVAGY